MIRSGRFAEGNRMDLANKTAALLGLLLGGLLLQTAPGYAQEFGWARQLGGPEADVGYDVAADGAGNVYVAGYFNGVVDFDPGAGVANLTSGGGDEIFVAKFDSTGSLIWARRMGGADHERADDIAIDAGGDVYATGWFAGTADFDPGGGTSNLTATGEHSAFVVKLDSSGNFAWAKMLGGAGSSEGAGIAVDANGNVYSAGTFSGETDFDPGAGVSNLTSAGDDDGYVSKLDSTGAFVWARLLGGPGNENAAGLALDAAGNVLTTGAFEATADFDPGAGTANMTSAGASDVFVSKLDGAGNFVWARRFGGSASDYGHAVAVDGNGNVHTTGSFAGSVDFDPGGGIVRLISDGSDDAFVSKLSSQGVFVWAGRMGGADLQRGAAVAVDGSSNVYIAGMFQATADFDPGPGVFSLTAAGEGDAFVAKLASSGNFVWVRSMGGAPAEAGEGIAVSGGDVYASGRFQGTGDFDPGAGVLNLTSAGDNDAFLLQLTGGSGGAPPSILSGGIVVANLLPKISTVSPLSIISVFGQNFATQPILYPNLDDEGKLATILGGTCLTMNNEPLPIFAVTPGQINAQVSVDKIFGPVSFRVVTNCGTEDALTSAFEAVTVEEVTPSFFIFNPVEADGFIAARFNATSTQPAAAVAPEGMFNDQYGPSRPAKPKDVIVLYGTGWGDTAAGLTTGQLATEAAQLLPSANRKITLGGIQLAHEDVLYVGVTPQTAGLYQAVIRIPANTTPGNKQVVLTVYGKSTPVGPVIPIGAP